MLFDRNVLLLTTGYFCSNYVFYIFSNWLIEYLVKQRGYSLGVVEHMEAARVDDTGEPWLARAAGRLGEVQHVANEKLHRQAWLGCLALRRGDSRWRDIHAHHLQATLGKHQRVLATPAATVEDGRRDLASIRQGDEHGLGATNVPRRLSVPGVGAIPRGGVVNGNRRHGS